MMQAPPALRTRLVLLLLLHAAFFAPTANSLFFPFPVFPMVECFIRLAILFPDFAQFDQYDRFFREDSVMELAQAGQYVGPDAIAEYVRFVYSETSPYITQDATLRNEIHFRRYDWQTGQCEFLSLLHDRYTLDPNFSSASDSFVVDYMVKLFVQFDDTHVKRQNVFYPVPFLTQYLGTYLNSPNTRDYVCNLYDNDCSGLVSTPTNTDCVTELAALPAADFPGAYVDGLTQGCRALHALFVEFNPTVHCPHLSFQERIDPNGAVKCQTSDGTSPEDLFDPFDFHLLELFTRSNGIDPNIGFKIEG